MSIELVLGSAAALLVLWAVLSAVRRRRCLRDWPPQEIRRAKLVHAEWPFSAQNPVRVTARVDRAYRNREGSLVLVELKTRFVDQYYLSDVIELSAQRYALMGQTGDAVAVHGYVVVERGPSGPRRCFRVDLLDHRGVEYLANRHQGLIHGRLVPRAASSNGPCTACAYRSRCWPGRQQGYF